MKKLTKMEKSKGHILFWEGFEFLQKGGEIYRAPLSDVIMTDGNRCGRWECSSNSWLILKKLLNI